MRITWLIALMAPALVVNTPAGAESIAREGKAVATIVVPAEASETETFAAEELKSFLDRITGAEFQIAAESGSESPRLLVGRTKASGGLADELAEKHIEAFAVKTQGDDLLLVGACDRSTMYAVYSYLEDNLGCRWLGPGERWIVTPEKSTVALDTIDRVESPALDYRFLRFLRQDAAKAKSPFVMDCLNWNARLRVNIGYGTPNFEPDPEIARRGGVRGWMTPHNLGSLIDIPKLAKDHPEWLALVDGERKPTAEVHFTNLCTAQPGVADVVAEGLIRRFEADPQAEFLSLGPGDGLNFCQCEECRSIDTVGDEWSSHSGKPMPVLTERWLDFCNNVGKRLEETHPGKKIYTLAYHQTFRPPRPGHVQPDPNVMVQIVNCRPNHVDFVHRIEHPTSTRHASFRAGAEKWIESTSAGTMIYQYTPHSQFRRLPAPMPQKFADDIRWIQRKGMVGYEGQSNTQELALNTINLYVIGKATWDPDLNVDLLIDDYCRQAFGDAAEPMKKFYDAMEEAMEKSDPELMNNGVWRYLTPEALAEGRKLLDEAKGATDDLKVLERLEELDSHFRYAEGCVGAMWMCVKAMETQDGELLDQARQLADQANANLMADFESGVIFSKPNKKAINGDLLEKIYQGGSLDRY